MIAKDLRSGQLRARNVLDGKVAKVQDGAVNSEVTVKLTSGADVVSTITKETVKSLGLTTGDSVSAIVKASNVMVGVDHCASTPSSSVLSVPESPNRICG